ASRYLFILKRLSSLRASHGAEGQAAGRLQRLGIRRLARRLLSAGDAQVGVSETLLERLRLCRGRFFLLPQPGARDDEGPVQVHAAGVSLPNEDAEANHPREEAQGRGGEPGLVLRAGEGAEGEMRAAGRPPPAVDQV